MKCQRTGAPPAFGAKADSLARKFATGVEYSEARVNAILKRHHADAATLRREMIGYRMLAREGGVYRLWPESEWRPSP